MLEFFYADDASHATPEKAVVLVRLLISVLCGLFIAVVYRNSHGRHKHLDNQAMFTTLVLLCLFIAMVSMVIGNSVAMAFSLVGALSIVRFRTVVDDTRDTAFVILSVITGMAIGSGYFSVPAIGLPIAAVVAIMLHHSSLQWGKNATSPLQSEPMQLTIRIGIGKDAKALLARIAESFQDSSLMSTTTTKQGSAIEVISLVRLKPVTDPIDFVSATNLIDGIQAVELKSLS
jgi:uncharacterized membrane protein YhiD involved in acid resistance